MRWKICLLCLCALAPLFGACVPQFDPFNPASDDPLDPVKPDQSAQNGSTTPPTNANTNTRPTSVLLDGSVSGLGYQLFSIGSANPGDRWVVSFDGAPPSSWFVVTIFDGSDELLFRQPLSSSTPLDHIVRASADELFVGVAPLYGGAGGPFRFRASRGSASAPPPQRAQIYLNFAGGQSVSVHGRAGLTFGAFDAAGLGDEYSDATEEMKALITESVREDYAPFDVVIYSSDEGPPPAGPYETLHFGGNDSRLLGLADSVDQYNETHDEVAVIYVEAFADYAVMGLSVDEMGQMIANTASHELGHLLGLFHTADPDDLMDTTGTAWDLTANQAFVTGKLEPSVFPFGFENSPQRLLESLGYNPEQHATSTKAVDLEKQARKATLRALTNKHLTRRCGTCLNPDGLE